MVLECSGGLLWKNGRKHKFKLSISRLSPARPPPTSNKQPLDPHLASVQVNFLFESENDILAAELYWLHISWLVETKFFESVPIPDSRRLKTPFLSLLSIPWCHQADKSSSWPDKSPMGLKKGVQCSVAEEEGWGQTWTIGGSEMAGAIVSQSLRMKLIPIWSREPSSLLSILPRRINPRIR